MSREERTASDGFFGRMSAEFTTTTWVLIPLGVAISTVGGFLTNVLKLPVYLDGIGTILLALLAGPWAAALTGVFTNVVESAVINPTYLPFGVTNAALGLVAGYMALGGWFRSYRRMAVVALVLTVIGLLTSVPIQTYVFGGFTGAGTDVVTGFLLASGQNLLNSVLGGNLVTEPLDKFLSVYFAYFVAQSIPRRYLPPTAQDVLPDD